VLPLLDAVLSLFPLDRFVPRAVSLMAVVPGDQAKTDIWEEYRRIVRRLVERFAFHERAREAFAVLATSETAVYVKVILKKGLVTPGPTGKP
jgi:L-fucose mutarotase